VVSDYFVRHSLSIPQELLGVDAGHARVYAAETDPGERVVESIFSSVLVRFWLNAVSEDMG
jgi:hypothetical protein